jgi:acetyl esterase/lipase
MKLYAGIVLLLVLSCTTNNASLNGNLSENSVSNEWKDIQYGNDERQKLDISIPANIRVVRKLQFSEQQPLENACFAAGRQETARTVRESTGFSNKSIDVSVNAILFIHGGGLIAGNKNEYPRFLDYYKDTMIVSTMNYRFVNKDVKVNDILEDIDAALTVLKTTAQDRGLTIGKVIIMGYSAGGYLALLYSYKYFESSPIPIAFCTGISAVTDFTDINYVNFSYRRIRGLKGVTAYFSSCTGEKITENDLVNDEWNLKALHYLELISPHFYIKEGIPPTILVHDVADKTVPFSNSASLRSALNILKIPNVFIASPSKLGHSLGQIYIPNTSRKYDEKLELRILSTMKEYIELYVD